MQRESSPNQQLRLCGIPPACPAPRPKPLCEVPPQEKWLGLVQTVLARLQKGDLAHYAFLGAIAKHCGLGSALLFCAQHSGKKMTPQSALRKLPLADAKKWSPSAMPGMPRWFMCRALKRRCCCRATALSARNGQTEPR